MPPQLSRVALLTALVLATACAERMPSDPEAPAVPPDLTGSAFRLTIDAASGRVDVAPPGTAGATASALGAPSFSILGSESIEIRGTGAGGAILCTWSSVPNNAKLRRCTFDFTVTNRLGYTDLVTPTSSFPRLPQGASGVLVFPFTAAGLGAPGSNATPTLDWDYGPANFFNDFSGCVNGKTSDCSRWESVASPLYAGATSEAHRVGFDVDKAAQTVTAYIAVAADLRDNPVRTLTISPEGELCGWVSDVSFGSNTVATDVTILQVASYPNQGSRRSFCSFSLADLPPGVTILSANIRLYVTELQPDAEQVGPVIVDHMNYGLTLDDDDFNRTALTSAFTTLPLVGKDVFQTLPVANAIEADVQANRARSQYRFRYTVESAATSFDNSVYYYGPKGEDPPTLTITYRNP